MGHTPGIPELGRWQQEDQKLRVNLSYNSKLEASLGCMICSKKGRTEGEKRKKLEPSVTLDALENTSP